MYEKGDFSVIIIKSEFFKCVWVAGRPNIENEKSSVAWQEKKQKSASPMAAAFSERVG